MTSLTQVKRVCLLVLTLCAGWAGLVTVLHVVALQKIEDLHFITPTLVPEIFVAMCIFCIVAVATASAALVLRRRATCSVAHARASIIVLIMLGLFSLDRAAGYCFPPPSELNSLLEPHPERGWTMRRGVVGSEGGVIAHTSSLGLRCPEMPKDKPAGELRILFLGDSVCFGYGLTDDQTLSGRSGSRLKRLFPRAVFRCMNAGVCGYTTWQERHFLEHEGLGLQPDLVVLQFSLNDISDALLIEPGRVHGHPVLFEFSNVSHWSGMVRAITNLRARRSWRKTLDTFEWIDDRDRNEIARDRSFCKLYAEPPPAAMEEGWQRSFIALTAFDELCRSRHLPWVLVVTPPGSEFDPEAAGLRPQKRLRAWADEHHVLLFDALPLLENYLKSTSRPATELYLDDGHPAALAVSMIADSLVDFLVDCKVVRREGDRAIISPTDRAD